MFGQLLIFRNTLILNCSLQCALAVALLGLFGFTAWKSQTQTQTDAYIKVSLYVGENDLYTRPELYIGHAIDASIIVKPEWEKVDFKNEKLQRAMKLISPIYIRFGGIMSDHTFFERERPEDFR